MCLIFLDEQYSPPKEGVGVGYKILKQVGPLLNNIFTLNTGYVCVYPKGEWIEDTKKETVINVFDERSNSQYKSGFHLFTTLDDAKVGLSDIRGMMWKNEFDRVVIYKVEYDHVVAVGPDTLGHLKTIVAQKLRLIEECV